MVVRFYPVVLSVRLSDSQDEESGEVNKVWKIFGAINVRIVEDMCRLEK